MHEGRSELIRTEVAFSATNKLFNRSNYHPIVKSQSPRRYPYFDVVVGLVWSYDPKSYAGGSVYYW
jgi:hypothetical protein